MTSSPDELPPALSSMWRLCKLGYHHEPRLIVAAFSLALISAVPSTLFAIWMKLLTEAVLDQNRAAILFAAVAIGVSSAATWFMNVVSVRVQRRFRDKVTIALESHVAGILASVSTIEHQERPDYLDRLSVLRQQMFVLDHMYMSLFAACGWIFRLVVTIGLLVSVHPALSLIALFAIPAFVTSTWRPAVERAAQEKAAPHDRLAKHLFTTATTAPPGKEVRVTGIGDRLLRQRRAEWEQWYGPIARARNRTALFHAVGWALFGLAYVASVVFVSSVLARPVADVVLVVTAGWRLSDFVGGAVAEVGFLRGVWMDGSKRLVWLERYVASLAALADIEVPQRLTEGIRFDHVSFAYPGTDRLVLDDVDLFLPAGAVVAVVGENGAGKTTMVKLLAKLYEPTSGQILVDGSPLRRMPADGWRARMSGAFQDFFRFEFRTRHSVGVGDVPRLDDQPAVVTAVGRAGADDVVERLANGFETQLGPTWPDGVEVSFGQWQKLALARGFMRDGPLLLVLDEPTAALDAETEHALFERYAAATRREATDNGDESARRATEDGRITILVSHRFSTVRMADLIVVLDGSRVVEVGTHEDLVARGGQYAELYGIQAAAYR